MKKLLLVSMAVLLCVPFLAGCDDDDGNNPPPIPTGPTATQCNQQGKEFPCTLDPLPSEPATPPPLPTEH